MVKVDLISDGNTGYTNLDLTVKPSIQYIPDLEKIDSLEKVKIFLKSLKFMIPQNYYNELSSKEQELYKEV